MTPVGFEPTPFRNGAFSHRLRPLGQSVLVTYPSSFVTALLYLPLHSTSTLFLMERGAGLTWATTTPGHAAVQWADQ